MQSPGCLQVFFPRGSWRRSSAPGGVFTRIVLTVLLVFGLLSNAPAGRAGERGHGGGHGHDGRHGRHFHHGPRGRVFIGVAPFWWDPYWYPSYWYEEWSEPPVYVERPPAQSYWYYCPTSNAYYPTVPSCPDLWIRVLPRRPPAF